VNARHHHQPKLLVEISSHWTLRGGLAECERFVDHVYSEMRYVIKFEYSTVNNNKIRQRPAKGKGYLKPGQLLYFAYLVCAAYATLN
jgi:hypothetical protein